MKRMESWKIRARKLKLETYALYLACRDPRVSLHAKIIAGCIVAYAFSPIDLIPDFIPILGYLDDLILLPFGIMLALKLVPPPVLNDCREKAAVLIQGVNPVSKKAAAVIVMLWLLVIVLSARFLLSLSSPTR